LNKIAKKDKQTEANAARTTDTLRSCEDLTAEKTNEAKELPKNRDNEEIRNTVSV
jgi:hypothetical protein